MGDLVNVNFGGKFGGKQAQPVGEDVARNIYDAGVGFGAKDVGIVADGKGWPMGMAGTDFGDAADIRSFEDLKLVAPNMTFDIDVTDMTAEVPGVGPVTVPSHQAYWNRLTGDCIGVNGRDYGCISNQAALSLFDGHKLAMGGTFKGGAVVWAAYEVNRYEVVPGDEMVSYMLLMNNHNSGGALRVVDFNGRFSCLNMIAGILRRNAGVSIRHTKFAEDRLQFAARAVRYCATSSEKTQELFSTLASRRFSASQLEEVLRDPRLVPDHAKDPKTGEFVKNNTARENNRAQIAENFAAGRGIQDIPGVEGTAWAAVNAITEYTSHQRTSTGDEARFQSVVSGSGQAFARDALRLIGERVGVKVA